MAWAEVILAFDQGPRHARPFELLAACSCRPYCGHRRSHPVRLHSVAGRRTRPRAGRVRDGLLTTELRSRLDHSRSTALPYSYSSKRAREKFNESLAILSILQPADI